MLRARLFAAGLAAWMAAGPGVSAFAHGDFRPIQVGTAVTAAPLPARQELPVSLAAPSALPQPAGDLAVSAPMAAPAASPRSAESGALPALVSASVDSGRSGEFFDGRRMRPPSEAMKPGRAPDRSGGALFQKALSVTALATAAAPVVWGEVPAVKAGFLFASSSLMVLGVLGAARLLRKGLPMYRRWTAAALGVALGLGTGAAPQLFTGPLAESAYALSDHFRHEALAVRSISGFMPQETVRVLSRNPVGRQILAQLKDRSGVIRPPTFFIASAGGGEAAHYEAYFDGVYIDENALIERGWTREEFLARPDLQKIFIEDIQVILAHEFVHAAQARRPVTSLERSPFSAVLEREYEAYAFAHLYVHEMLKANPRVAAGSLDLNDYEIMLDGDLLAGLSSHDSDYPGYRRFHGADWRAFYAHLNPLWPTLRVEGYVLLARRDWAHASVYLEKARRVAEEAGLPAPALMVP